MRGRQQYKNNSCRCCKSHGMVWKGFNLIESGNVIERFIQSKTEDCCWRRKVLVVELLKEGHSVCSGLSHMPLQFLADQLTLSQPGGSRLCPPNDTSTPGFSDLPRALQWSWSGTMDLCIEIRVRDRLDLCVIVLLKRKLTHSRRINSTLIVCAGSRDWR